MQNPKGGKRFSHLSVRISSDLRNELEKELRRQRITVNALVNRALERYLAFDRMTDHDHSVVLEGRIFVRMIEKVRAEDLEEIAKELGPMIVKQDFAFFNISPTLDNLVTKYFEPVGAFSDRFDFNFISDPPNLKLILAHQYGRKWSGFLAEYAKGIIESVLGVQPLIEVGDNLVEIEFRA